MSKKKSKKKSSLDENDVISLIMEDHEALKELIDFLKSSDTPADDKVEAFEEFALLLDSHAKPEQESLYEFMKQIEELRTDAFEGEVEHNLADQLVEEIRRTEDEEEWNAKVKVLAEIIEHHIEEEEEELLPNVKKATKSEERIRVGQQFMDRKAAYMLDEIDEGAPEALLDEEDGNEVELREGKTNG